MGDIWCLMRNGRENVRGSWCLMGGIPSSMWYQCGRCFIASSCGRSEDEAQLCKVDSLLWWLRGIGDIGLSWDIVYCRLWLRLVLRLLVLVVIAIGAPSGVDM